MSYIAAGNTTTTALTTYGDSTGNLVFTTGGANTTALTLSNTQAATFAGNVTITGTTTHTGNAAFTNVTASGVLTTTGNITTTGSIGVGTTTPSQKVDVVGSMVLSGQSTADQFIRIGSGRTGNGYSYLDLQGDTTYSNGMRLIRLNNGANAASNIEHYGTGALQLVTQQSAPIDFYTNATLKMRLDTNGSLLVNQTTVSNGFKMRINGIGSLETGDGTDNTNYGVIQITRPATQSDNTFGLSFVRQGNKVAGMGYLQSSNTFAIQNQQNNSGPGVTLTDGATSWGTTSDERKKDIIGNINNALAKLADWRSVYFKYKNDTQEDPQRVGLIAQEVQATLPEAVSIEPDEIGTLQLRYTETIPLLVAAIQELNAKVDAQTKRITDLEEQVLNLGTK
jgi:hypothetical protein